MGRKILLMVEDDNMLVGAIRRSLKGAAEVVSAETCEQALAVAAARRDEIGVILVDWTLESETTEAIIPVLRAGFGEDFPIYGWSGFREGQSRQRELGCTESFDKLHSMQVINRLRAHFQDA